MDTINQRRTAAAATGITKPPGAMNSAFDTGGRHTPTKPDKTDRRALPPLQLAALRVAKDVPMPTGAGRSQKGQTRHDPVFDTLTADGMSVTGIPKAYYGALCKATQAYLKARPALAAKSVLLVRTIDDRTIGVWRMAKAAAPATKAQSS